MTTSLRRAVLLLASLSLGAGVSVACAPPPADAAPVRGGKPDGIALAPWSPGPGGARPVVRPPILLGAVLSYGTSPVTCRLYRSSSAHDRSGSLSVSVPVIVHLPPWRSEYVVHVVADGYARPDHVSGTGSGVQTATWSLDRIGSSGIRSIGFSLDPYNDIPERNEPDNGVRVLVPMPAGPVEPGPEQVVGIPCWGSPS